MNRVRRLLSRLDPLVQIGLLIALAEAYRLLRRLIPTDWPQAIANAQRVERLEHVGRFAWEKGIQNWFLQFPDLVKVLNWFYLSSHFVVTGVFFVWLYWRDREGFSIFRDGFLLATAIALVIHWRYPTAPPRLAGMGVRDTIDLYSGLNIGKPHHERSRGGVEDIMVSGHHDRQHHGRGIEDAERLHEDAACVEHDADTQRERPARMQARHRGDRVREPLVVGLADVEARVQVDRVAHAHVR